MFSLGVTLEVLILSVWRQISNMISAFGGSVLGVMKKLGSGCKNRPEASLAFTIGVIALGAKMAKADGLVTPVEVQAFRDVFHVQPEEMANVTRVFNLAKKDTAGYESYARQVARLFKGQKDVLEGVMDGLFHIAKADGVVHDAEWVYLNQVAQIFGFDDVCFERISARHIAFDKTDPYTILGVNREMSDRLLKACYRQLVIDNHPDRHIAAGLPEEMVMIATEKLAVINAAYDKIALERRL